MISYAGTLGSAWGSRQMTSDGFMLNNAMNFFTYEVSNANENNNVAPSKQPRALFTPLLAYNEKNPCVRRFSLGYSQYGKNTDDFGLTGNGNLLFFEYIYQVPVSAKNTQFYF